MALVIFCVALVEARRTRMSFSEAIDSLRLSFVMPGLVPGIHVFLFVRRKAWMTGTIYTKTVLRTFCPAMMSVR